MSDILIRGMEMPKEGFVEILIRDDGTVQQTGKSYRIDGTDYYTPYVGEMPVIYGATPVHDHGRLIDADALKSDDEYFIGKQMMFGGEEIYSQTTIDKAPTIIPASEEGET